MTADSADVEADEIVAVACAAMRRWAHGDRDHDALRVIGVACHTDPLAVSMAVCELAALVADLHDRLAAHTGVDPDRSWHTTLTEAAKGRAQ